jgi:hypothetical protein
MKMKIACLGRLLDVDFNPREENPKQIITNNHNNDKYSNIQNYLEKMKINCFKLGNNEK